MFLNIHPPKENVFDDLNRFIARISRPGNAEVRKVGDAVRQGFAESFTREGSGAGPWAPLAAMTVLERIQAGYGGAHPIMRREGNLRASYIQAGARDHVSEFSITQQGWTLDEGSSSAVGFIQAYGTDRIPPRPPWPFSDAAEARIESVLERFVEEARIATVGR